jgi:hypothetical protein
MGGCCSMLRYCVFDGCRPPAAGCAGVPVCPST